MAKAALKLVAGIGVAAAVLMALEVGARVMEPPDDDAPSLEGSAEELPVYFSADPLLGWRQRPGVAVQDPIRRDWYRRNRVADPGGDGPPINSLGHRDQEPASPPPEGQYRALLLGDSSVWGSGVPFDKTFARRVEHRLAGDRPDTPEQRPVELLNSAVPGYTSWQSRVVLDEMLSADLQLDALVIYSMVSDFQPTPGVTDDQVFSAWSRRPSGLLSGMALYRVLYARLRPAAPVAEAAGGTTTRVSLGTYRSNLEALVADAKAEGLAVVFIVPPVVQDLGMNVDPLELDFLVRDDAHAAELSRLVAQAEGTDSASARWPYRITMSLVARTHDLPLVPGPLLVRQAWQEDRARFEGVDGLFVDPVHPSATGHALLADGLAPVLAELAGVTDARGKDAAEGGAADTP